MKKLIISIFFLSLFIHHSRSENTEYLDSIGNCVIDLFKQEKYLDCYNLAKDLYSLSKEADYTTLVFNSLYYMGFSNQRMGNMEKAIDYNMKPTRFPIELPEIDTSGSYVIRVITGTGRVLTSKLIIM